MAARWSVNTRGFALSRPRCTCGWVRDSTVEEDKDEFAVAESTETVGEPTPLSVSVREESFSGPLPHPSILMEYEEIEPGSAKRIIDMAERAMIHQQEMEAEQVRSEVASNREAWARSRLGAIIGGVVALAFAGVTLGIVLAGYPTAGAALGGLEVGALVAAFMYGTRRQ